MLSFIESALILSLTPILWGIYVTIRKHHSAAVDSFSFTIIFTLTQFIFTIIVWVADGCPWIPGEITAELKIKILLTFLGGFTVIIADYILLASSRYMPSSVSCACFDSSFPMSIIANYFISPMSVRPAFLFGGTAICIVGLASTIYSDRLKELKELGRVHCIEDVDAENHQQDKVDELGKPRPTPALTELNLKPSRSDQVSVFQQQTIDDVIPFDNDNNDDVEMQSSLFTKRDMSTSFVRNSDGTFVQLPTSPELEIDAVDKVAAVAGTKAEPSADSVIIGESLHDKLKHKVVPELDHMREGHVEIWTVMLFVAAFLNTMWNVFPAFASIGSTTISSPTFTLLLIMSGQLISTPFVIFFFGYVDLFKVADAKITGLSSLWNNLRKLPLNEVCWCVFIGIIVAVGYVTYFFATIGGVVPPSVALGCTFAACPISVLTSVLYGEYTAVGYKSKTFAFVVIGWILFAVAIYIFLFHAFKD